MKKKYFIFLLLFFSNIVSSGINSQLSYEIHLLEQYLWKKEPLSSYKSNSCQINYLARKHNESENSSNKFADLIQREKELKESSIIYFILKNFSNIQNSIISFSELSDLIVKESSNYDIDPLLILALIQTESSFHSRAVSQAGALGLMQIRPFVGQDIAKENYIFWSGDKTLFNPSLNIRMGIYYFAKLKDFFNLNRYIALAAYNYGPEKIKQYIRQGISIPDKFSKRVLDYYDYYHEDSFKGAM